MFKYSRLSQIPITYLILLLTVCLKGYFTFKYLCIIILERLNDYGSVESMAMQDENGLRKRIIEEMKIERVTF